MGRERNPSNFRLARHGSIENSRPMSPALHSCHRPIAFAFFTVLAARCLANLAMAAEPVTDPFPAKIEKGPMQIELQSVATGLGGPLLGVAPPGDRARLFVVEQT